MERTSINPLIKRIQNEGREAFGSFNIEKVKPGGNEAFRLWRKYKPEVYSLAALLTDPVIKDAYAGRNNSTIVEKVRRFSTIGGALNAAGVYLTNEIHTYVDMEMMKVLIGESNPQSRLYYMRLMYLLVSLSPVLPSMPNLRSVEELLKAGVNTGCDVMSNLHGVVGEHLASPRMIEFAPVVSENSYYFISDLSVNHADVMGPKVRALRRADLAMAPLRDLSFVPFDPAYFKVVDGYFKGRIALSETGQLTMDRVEKEQLLLLESFEDGVVSQQTDCLARGKVNGVTSFRQVWDWDHEIATELFQEWNRRNKLRG